jgi:hypothetical protein
MTRIVLAMALGAITLFTAVSAANADVLLIDEVRQADAMALPSNGMDKDKVLARFGQPAQMHEPVGDPPITRWDYERWSVYFEYDLVLYTVLEKGQVLDKSEAESS